MTDQADRERHERTASSPWKELSGGRLPAVCLRTRDEKFWRIRPERHGGVTIELEGAAGPGGFSHHLREQPPPWRA